MEAIDTQRRFEELISELERLKNTAELIEENASNTEELSSRTADILGELGELVPSVEETIDQKVQLLQQKSENLGDVREEFSALLDQVESEHRSRLASLSETLDEALDSQNEFLRQYAQEHEEALNSVGSGIQGAVNTVEQRVVAVQDQVENAHEQTISRTGKIAKQSTRKTLNRLEKINTQIRKQQRRQLLTAGGLALLVATLIAVQLLGI
jgi:chromosome segregation ATPase